jgi:hypothetical protein
MQNISLSPQWLKIYILEALCEWPVAHPMLYLYATQIVTFFEHLLKTYAQDFNNYKGVGNFNDKIKEAEQVVKILLVYQTRVPTHFYLEIERLLQQQLDTQQVTRAEILTSTIHALLTNEYSSKECAFSAGIVFCHTLRAIFAAFHSIKKLPYERNQFIAEELVRSIFSSFPIIPRYEGPPVLKIILLQFSSEALQFSAVPKILTYRGVMLSLESEKLLSTIGINSTGQTRYCCFVLSTYLADSELF